MTKILMKIESTILDPKFNQDRFRGGLLEAKKTTNSCSVEWFRCHLFV